MKVLIWLPAAVLAASGLALLAAPVEILPGSAQQLAGSGMLLVAFWLALYILRHRTAVDSGVRSQQAHDAVAFVVHAVIAATFFVVMQRAGWSPRLDDNAVRESVTSLLLAGIAWQIISTRWVRRLETARSDAKARPATFRTAVLVQVILAAAYLGINAERLPLLAPMLVANSVIQMLLLAAAIDALRTLLTSAVPLDAQAAKSES